MNAGLLQGTGRFSSHLTRCSAHVDQSCTTGTSLAIECIAGLRPLRSGRSEQRPATRAVRLYCLLLAAGFVSCAQSSRMCAGCLRPNLFEAYLLIVSKHANVALPRFRFQPFFVPFFLFTPKSTARRTTTAGGRPTLAADKAEANSQRLADIAEVGVLARFADSLQEEVCERPVTTRKLLDQLGAVRMQTERLLVKHHQLLCEASGQPPSTD